MKLNLEKCVFGVAVRKFLSFMVLRRDIEANPKRIITIMEMQPPNSTKVVRRLKKRIVALSCFIYRTIDKFLQFFKGFRKIKGFQ